MFVDTYPIRRYKSKKPPEKRWGKTILFFIIAILILAYLMLTACNTPYNAMRKQSHDAIYMIGTGPVLTDSLIKSGKIKTAFIRNDTLFYNQ